MNKTFDLTDEIKKFAAEGAEFIIFDERLVMKRAANLSMSVAAFQGLAKGMLKNEHKIEINDYNEIFEIYLMADDETRIGQKLRKYFLETVIKDFGDKRVKKMLKNKEIKKLGFNDDELIAACVLVILPKFNEIMVSEKK